MLREIHSKNDTLESLSGNAAVSVDILRAENVRKKQLER